MMFDKIFHERSIDGEFNEYLDKALDDIGVDDLQLEIQLLIGDVIPRFLTPIPFVPEFSD